MSKNRAPRIAVFGTRWLGAEVLEGLAARGFDLCLICHDAGDRSVAAARALGIPVAVKADAIPLQRQDFAWRPDLIVSAHSFRLIPAWVAQWSRFGAMGYHPSLLPAFKGRHAVRDAVATGCRVSGGTVYWLTDTVDAGPVVVTGGRRFQEEVHILPFETEGQLWRRALALLGRDLLIGAVCGAVGHSGDQHSPTRDADGPAIRLTGCAF